MTGLHLRFRDKGGRHGRDGADVGRLHRAARAPLEASYWRIIVVAMVLMATGLALSTGPATDAILGSLPAAKVGVGSAVKDTTREVGGVLDVAVTGSVTSCYYGSRLGTAWGALGIAHAAVQIGKGSVGAGLAIAQKVPGRTAVVTLAVKNAFMAGMHAGSFTVAAVTFEGAIAACLCLRHRARAAGHPGADPGRRRTPPGPAAVDPLGQHGPDLRGGPVPD